MASTLRKINIISAFREHLAYEGQRNDSLQTSRHGGFVNWS